MGPPPSALCLIVIIIGGCAALLTPLNTPSAEALQIHNDHIVWLRVGVPHRWVRMRVRMDSGRSYLSLHPSSWSKSWTPQPLQDEYGQSIVRETVLIGSTIARMDLVIGRYLGESTTTAEGAQAEGVLGIGPDAPLWVVWRNFTKSRDYLYLGQVPPRVSAASGLAVRAPLADTWMHAGHGVSPFALMIHGRIGEHTRTSIESNCLSALRARDDSVDLVASQDMLVDVLAVAPDEQPCAVRTDYLVMIDPSSDFNVIPPVLTLHGQNRPPMFRVSGGAGDTEFYAVLFDMFSDMYVEVDTTSRAGGGVQRMANRMGFNDSVIVLGTFGMRRLEIGYQLDDTTGWVGLKHTGLSQRAQAHGTEPSAEMRHVKDITILVAGILLWAVLAAEPDPLFPQHAHEDAARFPHASHTGVQIIRPPPAPPAPQPANQAAVVITDQTDGGMRLSRRRPGTQSATPQPAAQPAVHTGPTKTEQLRAVARDASIKTGAVIQATFTMESEWPMPLDVLLYTQLLVDAICGLLIIVALRFYDTQWALSMVIYEDIASDGVGWASTALLCAAVFALSVAAKFCAGRDARLGSLCLQGQVLISLSLLAVSLFEWDLALGMLLVLIMLIGVVFTVMVLHTYMLMPQYHTWGRSPRKELRGVAAALGISWLFYSALAVVPFAIGRLWDNRAQSALIGIFLTLSIVLPTAMWLAINAFLYPLRVANAATKTILLVAQQQHSSISGAV